MKLVRRDDGTTVEVLEDGEKLRQPVMLMDAATRERAETLRRVLDEQVAVVDAAGNPAGHRGGFLYPRPGTPAARQADINDALAATRRVMLDCNSTGPGMTREQYIAQISDAWKGARP